MITGMKRGFVFLTTLFLWNSAFKLLFLTLVTYFMMRSGSTFQEISDTAATNQILMVGLSLLLFTIVFSQPNPLLTFSRSEIVTAVEFERGFYPQFLRGSVVACFLIFVFLLSGFYKYVGFFIQTDAPGWVIASFIFRVMSILVMVYLEEFLFRQKFLTLIKESLHPLRSILMTALFFALFKSFQFHLGFTQMFTLVLVGFALSLRAYFEHEFSSGAGLWCGFLVVTHCVFSLPVFGNEFQGALLLKYQIQWDLDHPWIRFLTGGSGGPLSSLAFQACVLLDIAYHFWKNQNLLLPRWFHSYNGGKH